MVKEDQNHDAVELESVIQVSEGGDAPRVHSQYTKRFLRAC